MPRLRFFIEGDASGYSKAMDEAERRQEKAKEHAQRVAETLGKMDERRLEMHKRLVAESDQVERTALERRLKMVERASGEMARSYQKAVKEQERAERDLTRLVDREAKERARAHAKEASDRAGALKSGAIGIARGTGALPFFPFGGGGLVTAAGAAGLGAGILARKAIGDQLELAAAIREVQLASRGSFDDSARLLGVSERLGISTETITTAMRTLNAAIADNPEQFAALGISLNNADGSARSALEVFEDVRRVLSESTGDANAMKVAQELLGRGYQDLLPLLSLTETELAAVTLQAQQASQVMDREAYEATMKYKASLDELGFSVNAIVERIGQKLIPMMAAAAEMALYAGDLIGKSMSTVPSMGNVAAGVPVIGGITNLIGNLHDVSRGKNNQQTREIAEFVERQAELRKRIAQIQAGATLGSSGGRDLSGATRESLAGSQRASADAQRQQLERLRELQQAERERVREVIDGIRDEQEAEAERHRAFVQDVEDRRQAELERIRLVRAANEDLDRLQEEARREAMRRITERRDAEVDAIRRATQAERDAEERKRILGQDTLSMLQARIDQLEGIAELEDEEERRAEARTALTEAEAELAKEQAVVVARFRSDTEEEYAAKVAEQQEKIRTAEKRVTDLRKAMERDLRRDALRAQADGIREQLAQEQQRLALERMDRDQAQREQLERIESTYQAERGAIEAAQKADQERRRLRDEALEEEVRLINRAAEEQKRADQDRSQSFRKATDEKIAGLERELKAFEKTIDAEIKKIQGLASAIAGIPGKVIPIVYQVSTVGTAPQGVTTVPVGSMPALTPGTVTGGGGGPAPAAANDGKFADRLGNKWKTQEEAIASSLRIMGGGGGHMIAMAEGGGLMLREPHFLVNARTGNAKAVAGEAGDELVFSPAGGRGGGLESVTVVVQGGVDSRERAFEIGQEQWRWYRLKGGRRR